MRGEIQCAKFYDPAEDGVPACPIHLDSSPLVPLELLANNSDPPQPFDVRHAVPAGNDQPERGSVLRRQRRPVHLVRQHDLFVHCFGKG